MALRNVASGRSGQTSNSGIQTPGRGRTVDRCSDTRTYSTISIPFLAGGETELPNIFTAIKIGARNVLRSFREWNSDPCAPSAPPPSTKPSRLSTAVIPYVPYKAPSRTQGVTTRDTVIGKTQTEIAPRYTSSAVTKPETGVAKDIRPSPNVSKPVLEKTEIPTTIQASSPQVIKAETISKSPKSYPEPPRASSEDAIVAETVSKVTKPSPEPPRASTEDAIVAETISKAPKRSPEPPRTSIEDAIVAESKRRSEISEQPPMHELSAKTQGADIDGSLQAMPPCTVRISAELSPTEERNATTAPKKRSVEQSTSPMKTNVELQMDPQLLTDEPDHEPPSAPTEGKKKSVEVQAQKSTELPATFEPRKSSGFSGHMEVAPSTITLHPIRTEVNISAMKNKSALLASGVPAGICGFKDARTARIQESPIYAAKPEEDKDFIDLFWEKGAPKYIDAMAKLEKDFLTSLENKFKEDQTFQDSEWNEVLRKTEALPIIADVEDEKELQDFDFPMVIAHDVGKFSIDVKRKIEALNDLHNYGAKKVLHWIYKLQKGLPIDPLKIAMVGTGLLAEMMIPSYGIFLRVANWLADQINNPASHHSHPPVIKVIHNIRNLVDTMADEIGAIGESSVQILIRIPGADEDRIIDIITRLYTQIQYADIALSRATEILVPMLKLYYIARRAKNN